MHLGLHSLMIQTVMMDVVIAILLGVGLVLAASETDASGLVVATVSEEIDTMNLNVLSMQCEDRVDQNLGFDELLTLLHDARCVDVTAADLIS